MSMITNNASGMSPFMALRKKDSTAEKETDVLKEIQDNFKDISSNGGKSITKEDVKTYLEAHPTGMTQAEMDTFLSSSSGSFGDKLFKGDDKASMKDLKSVNKDVRDHKILDLIYENRDAICGDDDKFSKKNVKNFFKEDGQTELKEAGLTDNDIKDFVEHSTKAGFFTVHKTGIAGMLFGKDEKASMSDLSDAMEKVIKKDGDFFASVF